MKNILKYSAVVFMAFTLLLSCDEDDLTGQSTLEIADPSVNIELDFDANQTFVEEDLSFPFTVRLSEPQVVNVKIYLSLSGTATEGEDIAFPHYVTISRGSTEVSDVIQILRDDVVEETETAIITIGTGQEANVSGVNSATATFTLQDYVFCTWNLVTTDTYGDGWNGGYVELTTTSGGTVQYAADGSGSTFDILMAENDDYVFTYVSGGGGFCGGPGYECENYFMLTAPDGTVWEEGSQDYTAAPTEGEVTSGVNVCP